METSNMIKDRLFNAENYYNISENLKAGFEWLKNNKLTELEDGRYEIDGNNLYASIQTYITKEDANYESHREYIDIQYMIRGAEKIGVTDLKNCKTCIEYDSSSDLEFYDIIKDEEYLKLEKGDFMIFFPNDAHKPSISIDTAIEVKKVVVKVKI